MIYKATYVSLLKAGICTVLFTKADSTERVMKCTLNEEILPEDDREGAASVSVKRSTDNVVPCWDLEAKAWRSFRIDTVIEITYQSVQSYKDYSLV